MCDTDQILSNIRLLQSDVQGAFSNFGRASNNFLKAIERGINELEIAALNRSRSDMADKLLALSHEMAEIRKDYLIHGGSSDVLKDVSKEFSAELHSLMIEIGRIENRIAHAIRKSGIRITNRKVC
ncbi:MAG: hypothetical protein CO189_03980 [candidate division Zixibacteria bacterium CG_4_9_14_3_um_filter_46_8]|nr:MAG: hypothetical protein CO189_03980 [candidate division Zixibacteria bacterium CG_4_9_14_3_um_filter_46_8]